MCCLPWIEWPTNAPLIQGHNRSHNGSILRYLYQTVALYFRIHSFCLHCIYASICIFSLSLCLSLFPVLQQPHPYPIRIPPIRILFPCQLFTSDIDTQMHCTTLFCMWISTSVHCKYLRDVMPILYLCLYLYSHAMPCIHITLYICCIDVNVLDVFVRPCICTGEKNGGYYMAISPIYLWRLIEYAQTTSLPAFNKSTGDTRHNLAPRTRFGWWFLERWQLRLSLSQPVELVKSRGQR